MYILPSVEETKCCHEGTTVTVRDLESYQTRQGFVTHVFRSEEQITEAVEHMIQVQRRNLASILKKR